MSVAVLGVNVTVIINEVLVACVVRWINVDYINLSSVGIGKLRQSGKVVALDNEVVGSVWVIGDYWVDFIIVALDEDRKVFPQTFLNVLGLFFPYKPIFLVTSYKFKQCSLFLVAQFLKVLYFTGKIRLVHGTSGCFESA